MTDQVLLKSVENLERRIKTAEPAVRLSLQPEFHKALQRIRAGGDRVPFRLRRLESVLCDEIAEARFDNMPV